MSFGVYRKAAKVEAIEVGHNPRSLDPRITPNHYRVVRRADEHWIEYKFRGRGEWEDDLLTDSPYRSKEAAIEAARKEYLDCIKDQQEKLKLEEARKTQEVVFELTETFSGEIR